MNDEKDSFESRILEFILSGDTIVNLSVTSTIVITIYIVSAYTVGLDGISNRVFRISKLESKLEKLEEKINQRERELDTLSFKVESSMEGAKYGSIEYTFPSFDTLGTSPEFDVAYSITNKIESMNDTLNRVKKEVNIMKSNIDRIKSVVAKSPVEALEIQSIKREIKRNREEYETEVTSIRKSLNRLVGLGKWAIGIAVSLTLGILGLAYRS